MAMYYRIGGFTDAGTLFTDIGIERSLIYATEQPFVPESDVVTHDDDTLDTFIENNNFISPYEFYSKNNVGDEDQIVSEGYKNLSNVTTSTYKIFWVEDFKNWCTYTCEYVPYLNTEQRPSADKDYLYRWCIYVRLKIWNGRNDWIALTIVDDPRYSIITNINYDVINEDKYKIWPYQLALFSEIEKVPEGLNKYGNEFASRQHTIVQYRGAVSVAEKMLPTDANATYEAKNIVNQPYTQLQAIRLKKAEKYSINGINFQTKRWSKLNSYISRYATNDLYKNTGFRSFVTTGIPTVWRSSTGELCIATKLLLAADVGTTYRLTKAIDDNGNAYFKKLYQVPRKLSVASGRIDVYDKCVEASDRVEFSIAENLNEFQNYINELCISTFGDGRNKTIKNDWLRLYKISNDSQTEADYNNLLDSNLVFEQVNSNSDNNLKCSFVVNRPVIITDEQQNTDYVKKW